MKFLNRKPDTFDYQVSRTCLTCEHNFAGRYCPRCGEKVIEPDDRSFKHFLSGVFNAFTFIDGKFAKSIKQLILHPGALSRDIVIGIRQPYMKPVAFFFVGNFIYFLLPIFQTFNTTLNSQMNFMPYSAYATEWVNTYLVKSGQNLEQFSIIFNQASTAWSKLMLICLVLIFFPMTALINFNKKSYLSDHLMFALEYCTYVIFVATILLSFLLMTVVGIGLLFKQNWEFIFNDNNSTLMAVGLLIYFFIRATRTFYGFRWWRVAVSTVLMIFAMQVTLSVYRFMLFQVTMWELTR